MKVKRRYPNYFSGFDETEHEINTLEELKEIDWIKGYDKIPGHMGVFYSPAGMKGSPDLLMSLSKGEDDEVIYFVVGYIYGDAKELGLKNYLDYI